VPQRVHQTGQRLETAALDPGPLRVFVIEDMRHMQAALHDLLDTVGGFSVVNTARSETEATEWLQAHPQGWDIATIDLMLDSGTGFNMIERCRAAHGRGHIIVLSDFVTPVIKERCIALGADAVYRKTEAKAFAAYLADISVLPLQ
jgi:DNA-binding NarL/FixJ family response regulator